jgi:hypothetical protein
VGSSARFVMKLPLRLKIVSPISGLR